MSARILFICTGNIARSQLGEGLCRALAAPDVEVASAGTRPNPKGIHPFAVQVLSERGIDISSQRAKKIEDLRGEFDYVVTLCDDAVQVCPALPARKERLHWSIPDPGNVGDDPTILLATFRNTRDDLEQRLREWLGARGLLRENA